MISTGLVFITFRQLTAAKIVGLVSEAKLDGIEWGGDVHVPRLANVHVFQWHGPERTRMPLSAGDGAWRERLAIVAQDVRAHAALIEFVTRTTQRHSCRMRSRCEHGSLV